MFFGFLEFLGTTEFLVILFAALMLFGPRKLPQMTRKFGKSLSEFKRASEDFKRTWEKEVDLEGVQREASIARNMLIEDHSFVASNESRSRIIQDAADQAAEPRVVSSMAADADPAQVETIASPPAAVTTDAPSAPSPPAVARKRDWL